MRHMLRRRPSPAMVVACLALAVALTGTGVAALKLAPRSVGNAALKNGAVNSRVVKNSSIKAIDLVPGIRKGPKGAKGATGPPGPAGVIGDVVLHSDSVTVPGSAEGNGSYFTRQVSANCGSNEKGITGGTFWSGAADDKEQVTVYSRPLYDSVSKRITGWEARGGNDTVPNRVFTVYVICTPV
jgi:hypothetical protein